MRALVCLASCLAVGAIACSNGDSDPHAMSPMGGTAGMGTGGSGALGGTSGSSGGGTGPVCEEVEPGVAPLRLLTHVQYDNTVEDLLGDSSHPAQRFPAENEVLGYRNNVAANQVNPRLVEGFQVAAEELSARAVAERLNVIAPCESGDLAACGRAFVRDFGGRAFRRPLSSEETQIFTELVDRTAAEGYAKTIELVLQAMLQSPQFLYRVDALPSPTPETGSVLLGAYETAARLSYFLTNSMPDGVLMAKAAAGALTTDTEVEAEVRRLLETPRARAMTLDFVEQWLGLSRLNGAAREAVGVPYAPTELTADFKASLDAFVERVLWQGEGSIGTLFTSPKLFLTDKLASLYGVMPSGSGLTELDAPEERAGLLTQPALMALLAHADQSAPVLRGAFVLERILCLSVPDPPPEVNNTPPAVDPNATTRERFAQHTASAECAGCHVSIDGMGFGFERYDQFGRYRPTENGLAVDESGAVIESGESSLDGEYTGARELAVRISSSELARDCAATQWYRYAMGRIEDENDRCSLDGVKERFKNANGSFRELLVAIALSEAFRYRPAAQVAP